MPNPRNRNGHRRRQLRQRVLAHFTHCALCGQPIDKTLHHLDPGAPEVDEIIPVSRGGDPLDWRNVQLAHRVCNQRRGNKLAWTPSTTAGRLAPPATSRRW